MLTELALYLALGSVVGLLAGLLGVGGGLIVVPALASLFISLAMPSAIIMHLALGTSLATILATSTSSVYSHHKKHAVIWPDAWRLTPGILLGAWLGGMVAGNMSSDLLRPIFGCFELAVGAYMLWGHKVESHKPPPGLINFSLSGGVIGLVSALVGIGGGTMTVPWLMWHGRVIHQAIATSAAVGFPIALAGAMSYLFMGWNQTGLPEAAIGYIYLPALLGISLASILSAPLGAHWAHKLDTRRLKKIFALLLIVLGLNMLLF